MWRRRWLGRPPLDAPVHPPRATRGGACAAWAGRDRAAGQVEEPLPREAGGTGAVDGGGSVAEARPERSGGRDALGWNGCGTARRDLLFLKLIVSSLFLCCSCLARNSPGWYATRFLCVTPCRRRGSGQRCPNPTSG